MDLTSLKEFVVLADVGNYLEASDQLFIAQSTLSRHIKNMEEELGVVLFDRNTRKISLSEFGKTFLPYAQQILNIEQQYQYELFNFKRKVHGTLSVGSIPSMSQYQITDALFAFQQQNKNYSLNILEGDSTMLTTMILEGKIEAAFVRSSTTEEPDPRFHWHTYATDTLAAIMPRTHPLASKSGVRITDLANETLLLLASDTFMFRLCVNACRDAGFTPNIGFTGHRSENILSMVEKGAGIALLTQNPIRKKITDEMVMVPIEPKVETTISLIWRKDKTPSTQARQFIHLIEQRNP